MLLHTCVEDSNAIFCVGQGKDDKNTCPTPFHRYSVVALDMPLMPGITCAMGGMGKEARCRRTRGREANMRVYYFLALF